MPLMKKASKKAFEHNVKAEMDAGKPQPQSLAIAYSTQRMAKKKHMAAGGTVQSGSPDMNYAKGGEVDSHYDSIADAIMRKKKYAEGGQVEPDNMETPASLSPYDDDNYDAVMKELYEEDMEDQPMDSNEKGDEIDSDKHDMVSQIRKRMKR